MITPARINDISLDIADVYAHITDELLVNIGKHITSPNWTHTAAWEIQKLAELGQLTKENAAIINKWIKAIPPELRNAMEETRKAALDEIEKQMDAAAKRGYVTPPVTDSSVAVFQDMQNQAADRLNLVNTTMLQSSVDQYQRAIVLTQQEYERLMAQQEATQRALNEGAASVATGVETRRVAVRRAIDRIASEGLTGFVDRAGRHWSPEAYVNMDVRTTVHNTAIQATRARMSDFGTQVFQVSSHAGARPLCYPYQGKFYSWDNTAGTIELGDGSVVNYEPLNSTTYGQAAGLMGCNCGHYPIPIIAGITIPHGADNIQPQEENDKAYAESQEQRALERKIREAKRLVEMAGDSATPEDKQKIKDAQAQMRAFIERTGRTRRYDREQIGGTPNVKPTQTPPSDQNTVETVNAPLTPTGPTRDMFNGVKGVSEDFQHGMADVLLASGNETAIRLYEKYADELVCIDPNKSKGACFKASLRGVLMNVQNVAKGSDYEAPYEVAFHEFGHMIDWIAGGRNSFDRLSFTEIDGKTLLQTIRKDFQTFKKSLGVGRAEEVIPILKQEQAQLPKDKRLLVYGNVSDILEKCTGKSYPLGIGHGVSYHDGNYATQKEFFAEVLDSAIAAPTSYAQMQRIFPTAVDFVWKLVNGVLEE